MGDRRGHSKSRKTKMEDSIFVHNWNIFAGKITKNNTVRKKIGFPTETKKSFSSFPPYSHHQQKI